MVANFAFATIFNLCNPGRSELTKYLIDDMLQ